MSSSLQPRPGVAFGAGVALRYAERFRELLRAA